jgi:hypothetical protein
MGVRSIAKNTGRGHRLGAVKSRGNTWFKRDAATGRILNGQPQPAQGRPQREVTTVPAASRRARHPLLSWDIAATRSTPLGEDMNALLINYNLNKPGQNYDRQHCLRHILGLGVGARCLD